MKYLAVEQHVIWVFIALSGSSPARAAWIGVSARTPFRVTRCHTVEQHVAGIVYTFAKGCPVRAIWVAVRSTLGKVTRSFTVWQHVAGIDFAFSKECPVRTVDRICIGAVNALPIGYIYS